MSEDNQVPGGVGKPTPADVRAAKQNQQRATGKQVLRNWVLFVLGTVALALLIDWFG